MAVEVTLLDANDNNPVFFPSNIYEFTITADKPIGTIIGKVIQTKNVLLICIMKSKQHIKLLNVGNASLISSIYSTMYIGDIDPVSIWSKTGSDQNKDRAYLMSLITYTFYF